MNVENDEYVKRFMESRASSNYTSILRNISEFCEFCGKTPKELILEEHSDRMKDPLEQKGITEKRMFDFFNYLQSDEREKKIGKKCSYNSAITYSFGNVGGFFSANRLTVYYTKSIPRHKSKAYTKTWKTGNQDKKIIPMSEYSEIVQKIYGLLKSYRDKAIFLSELSSGLYSIDLLKKTIKDYKEGREYCETHEKDNCLLIGFRQKTKIPYATFLSSETCEIIDMYLVERKDNMENITDDSYLFVSEKPYEIIYIDDKGKELVNERLEGNQWTYNGNKTDGLKVKERKFKKCKSSAFRKSLSDITKTLQLDGFSPKSLRDYFETTVRKRVHETTFNMYVGYKGSTEVKEYGLGDLENGLNDYSEKVEPFLSVKNGKQIERKVNADITRIENQLKEKDNQIGNLTEMIENQNRMIENMMWNIRNTDTFERVRDDLVNSNLSNKEIAEGNAISESRVSQILSQLKKDPQDIQLLKLQKRI